MRSLSFSLVLMLSLMLVACASGPAANTGGAPASGGASTPSSLVQIQINWDPNAGGFNDLYSAPAGEVVETQTSYIVVSVPAVAKWHFNLKASDWALGPREQPTKVWIGDANPRDPKAFAVTNVVLDAQAPNGRAFEVDTRRVPHMQEAAPAETEGERPQEAQPENGRVVLKPEQLTPETKARVELDLDQVNGEIEATKNLQNLVKAELAKMTTTSMAKVRVQKYLALLDAGLKELEGQKATLLDMLEQLQRALPAESGAVPSRRSATGGASTTVPSAESTESMKKALEESTATNRKLVDMLEEMRKEREREKGNGTPPSR